MRLGKLPWVAVVAAAWASVADAATLVVLNKAEATASLIDLGSGKVAATLPTGVGPHEVDVSPDGRLALVANYGTREAPGSSLTLIDVPAGRVVRTVDLGEYRRPHGVQWLDARRAVVTAEGSRALLVVDVLGGAVASAVATGQDVSHMVAATPDGKRAFVANIASGTVTAVDLGALRVIRHIATGAGAEGIAVTPDGSQVWVTNRAADTVAVIDAATLKVMARLESKSFPIRARVTPDGAHVLVSNARSADVAVFDVASRKELRRIPMKLPAVPSADGRVLAFPGSPTPIGIVIEPGGRRAFVANAGADVVAVVDLAAGAVVDTLRAGREPDGMAYSVRDVGP